MKRSTERFLTTHTGSLPRPEDLIRTMYAKEEGVPVDAAALERRVAAAVAEVVQKQAASGVDVVNDARAEVVSAVGCVVVRIPRGLVHFGEGVRAADRELDLIANNGVHQVGAEGGAHRADGVRGLGRYDR